jgi:hypothetical protein
MIREASVQLERLPPEAAADPELPDQVLGESDVVVAMSGSKTPVPVWMAR